MRPEQDVRDRGAAMRGGVPAALRAVAAVVLVLLLGVACTTAGQGRAADPSAAAGAARPADGEDPGNGGGGVDGLVTLSLPAAVDSAADAAARPGGDALAVDHVDGSGHVQIAAAVSREQFDTVDTAVLVSAGSVPDAVVGAPLAAALGAPLLATDGRSLSAAAHAELTRLGVTDVVLVGGVEDAVVDALAEADVSAERVAGADRSETAALVAERLPPVGRVYVAGAMDQPAALAAAAAGARSSAPVLLAEANADGLDEASARALEVLRPSEVVLVGGPDSVSSAVRVDLAAAGHAVTRLSAADPEALSAEVAAALAADPGGLAQWVVASRDAPEDGAAALSASAASRAALLLVEPADPVSSEAIADALDGRAGAVQLVGSGLDDQAPRQLRAAAAGKLLPRGGSVLFPAHRMVAYYGNAQYSVLGVLGETDPQEAAETVERIAGEYADGEREVLPAFELIVSIALADAGPDGQYSALGPVADARRYLEVARANDQYLFLDFQPGRNRFLEQVRAFEELLREPDVGVALDPEWRMTDSQRPGQVIGSVDAEEVNEVADYLVEIVREEDLPQKLFVIHQFRFDMIQDRDAIATPPELATTIHVDGFGTQDLKLQTWNALARDEAPWFYGFKLFYDEDTDLFSPEQVVDFDDPPVDLITYQ